MALEVVDGELRIKSYMAVIRELQQFSRSRTTRRG
jgi:hypothetical protein